MILSSIAIGVSAFAVDSSRVVLQAIQIRETAAVVSWQSIVDTTKYRVYYDEESAIKEGADPLFDTEYTSDTQIEIGKLVAGTRYYFVVR